MDKGGGGEGEGRGRWGGGGEGKVGWGGVGWSRVMGVDAIKNSSLFNCQGLNLFFLVCAVYFLGAWPRVPSHQMTLV